ncbi:ATP-binding protein [Collinsella tanakaei]|uniref:ATP-binding protein n=1 Tax=Collinsella tanakaei TaxID=626935 RepID=UPI0025A337A5|nr:ATP-binding protein [Collinsella tanakaei]MDM8246137.1 ATP-binding protein [Collinsella tanakaei]
MNISSLWLTPPDISIVLTGLTFEEVLVKLDIHTFIDRLFPFAWPDQTQTQQALVQTGICTTTESSLLSITAAGALMLARDLAIFPRLYHAAPQVIRYAGADRLNVADRTTFSQGFLLALPRLVDHLTAILPRARSAQSTPTSFAPAVPTDAIRELAANTLIHQDLTARDAHPTIELFPDRIELTNPGPLPMEALRIADATPLPRNPQLSQLAKQLNLTGTTHDAGWINVIDALDQAKLPAPSIESIGTTTRAALYLPLPYREQSPEARRRACYWHACAQYQHGSSATNASIRERFDLPATSAAQVSRLLRDCVTAGILRPARARSSKRNTSYLPYWA